MSSDEYLSSKNRLFKRLNDLDTIFSYLHMETRIDKVNFFEREFKFLDIFLGLQGFTDDPNMLDVTHKVHALFMNAAVDFSSEFDLHSSFHLYTSKVRKRIHLTKKEIIDKYSFPKISLPLQSNKDGVAITKNVTEFIDTVVARLYVLVKIDKEGSLIYVPKTMPSVLEELDLLQNFLRFVSARFIEPQSKHHVVDLFSHVLAVAGHASMLVWLNLPGRGSRNQEYLAPLEINVLLSDFLRMMIKPIRPCIRKIYVDVLQDLKSTIQSGWYPNILNEDAVDSETRFSETIIYNLVELPQDSNSPTQRVALEDHLEILQKMINFFRPNIIHVPIQEVEFLLRDIDTVIIDVGLLVYSLYEGEEVKLNMEQVLDFSGNIQRISTMVYPITRKGFQSNLPRIHGLGYVDFLLNNLKEFQSRYSESLASVMNHLQIIQQELESLQPFLKAVSEEQHNDLDKIQRCATQLIGKAYEVEYIVDAACISKEVPVWCLEYWFSDIVQEITDIRAEVEKIEEKRRVDQGGTSTVTTHTSSNLARSPEMNEEIVGFEDVIEKLREQLIKGTRGRDVISIVGMPGLGKTTLAYRLYSDRLVRSHFDIRAQCCVSQMYSRKDLLLVILRDALGEDSKCIENHSDNLADQLRKTLFSKRYLILVDDVWENSVWDDLVGCFHDANNGSRIILTTRNHDVANYARYKSDPHLLRMFNDDESWKLLSKKVFGKESCSPVLTKIGQQIAKKCGQLPLSVALVAGILEKMEKKEECWEQLVKNLGPHIHRDSRAIIEHSYQNLPYHLRSCFLYFGAFLEDRAINVSKLTRLWISEGFIKSCEGKSLEDIAIGYFDNLIRRNLVTGARWSSGGKIKACRVHDLLYDFCKERGKEENLLLLIKWDQNDSPDVYTQDQPAHRLSLYDENGGRDKELRSSWSLVGSIILHSLCLSNYQVFDILHNFKFLKVLDLNSTKIYSYPTELVYLRYFSATTKKFIPSSIANQWNLETLILENQYGGWSLPVVLWKMVKLRHLNIKKGFVITNSEELLENTALETLSIVHFCCVKDAKLILRKTPNLRKLSCEVKSADNFQDDELNFPPRLETLMVRGPLEFPGNSRPFFISAPNLKNLKLITFHLVPCHLSNIGLLQNLEILKLYCITFDNKEWEVRDGEFPQLKVLKLDLCESLSEWSTVSDDAFPNLECLFLRYCQKLKEIPSCFGDISSLKCIKVDHCNESVAKSARDIRKKQVEYYDNSGLEVFIKGRGDVNSDTVDGEQEKEEDEY